MHRAGLRAYVGGVQVDVPITNWVAGQALRYNGSTNEVDTVAISSGISGPGTSVVGNLPAWGNTGGTALTDTGVAIANVVRGTGSPVVANVASWNSSSPYVVQDGGKAVASLVTGPASAAAGDIPVLDATGKVLSDGGVLLADVVRSFAGPQTASRLAVFVGTAPASVGSSAVRITQVMQNTTATSPTSVVGNIPTFNATDGISCADSGVAISNLPAFQKGCRATAATTTVAATMTDITGLAFSLPAAGTYMFEFIPIFSSSSATGTIGIAATCATATAFIMGGQCPTAVGAVSHLVCTAINTASANSTARSVGVGVNTMATFSGSVAVSGAGTLQFRMVANTSGTLTSAIGSGGFCTRVT